MTSDIVKESASADECVDRMGARLNEIAERFVGNKFGDVLTDGPPAEVMDEVRGEFDGKYREAFAAEEERKRQEEEEKRLKAEREAKAKAEAAKKLEIQKEEVRKNTVAISVANARKNTVAISV